MAALDSLLNDEMKTIVADCAKLASDDGECLFGSGRSRWVQGAIAFHTDFGPAEQDKDTNQDYRVGLGCSAGKIVVRGCLGTRHGGRSDRIVSGGAGR